MVVGIVLVVSTLFLTINLVVDLLRAALDPRIRTS
jgi:peptide/nickel transport system permease protein